MDTCICMTESLHCSLETITTLLIVYIPIKNAFGLKEINLQIERTLQILNQKVHIQVLVKLLKVKSKREKRGM